MTRVLNPIVSESYMKGYIRDEGLIKPEGNIELTENAENVDIAQYATATINVEGSGGSQKRYVTIQDTTSVVFAENNGMIMGMVTQSFAPYKFSNIKLTLDDAEIELYYLEGSGGNDGLEGRYADEENTIELYVATQVDYSNFALEEAVIISGDITEGTHSVKIEGYDESLEYVDGVQRNYILKDYEFTEETQLMPFYAPTLHIVFDDTDYTVNVQEIDNEGFIYTRWMVENEFVLGLYPPQGSNTRGTMGIFAFDEGHHTISIYYEGQEMCYIKLTANDDMAFVGITNDGLGYVYFTQNQTSVFGFPIIEHTPKITVLNQFDDLLCSPVINNGTVTGGKLDIRNYTSGLMGEKTLVGVNFIGDFAVSLDEHPAN